MDKKVFTRIKIGVLFMSIISTIATAWVTTKENKENIDEAVEKYMKEHNTKST